VEAVDHGPIDTLTAERIVRDLIGPRHPIDDGSSHTRRNFADDLGNIAHGVGGIVNEVTYVYAHSMLSIAFRGAPVRELLDLLNLYLIGFYPLQSCRYEKIDEFGELVITEAIGDILNDAFAARLETLLESRLEVHLDKVGRDIH
jgi:hypothetical protein